jgi:hypothetical protein
MDQLNYESVQREVGKRLLRYTFARGQGGPLVFLWVVGTGLFTISWNVPEYAAIWSVACLVFGALIARDALRNGKFRAQASRELLEARYPADRFADQHRETVKNAIDVFVELLGKLADTKRVHDLSEDVAETVSEMDRLLHLQCESALQAEELERILRFVGNGHRSKAADGTGLHQENVVAIRREVAEAEALIELISQRLETLLLQVYRADSGPADAVTRAEGRRRSAETLDRLQQIVDARRESARQLIDLVDPDFAELDLDAFVAARSEPVAREAVHHAEAPGSNGHLAAREIGNQQNGQVVVTQAELVPMVEEALRKLNNPAALASCELIQGLPHTLSATHSENGAGVLLHPTPLDQAHLLREALGRAIERLKPGPTKQSDQHAGRPESLHYDVLHEEYVQGLTTRAVMMRHNIAESTFHRYRRDAIRVLAQELLRQEELLAQPRNGHAHSTVATGR